MDEYDESSQESGYLDLADSIGSGLGNIADGIVDTARSAASLVGHANDLAGDEAQRIGHAMAATWAASGGDMEGAVYENYAAKVEDNEVKEDYAKIVHEDLGF
jgi:hypothetical protein